MGVQRQQRPECAALTKCASMISLPLPCLFDLLHALTRYLMRQMLSQAVAAQLQLLWMVCSESAVAAVSLPAHC